jgi:hypothetical protein
MDALGRSKLRAWTAAALLLAIVLVPLSIPAASALSAVPSTSTPLIGGVTGPGSVGLGLKTVYTVTASGGPAEAINGTQVGILSYKASISAVNTTGALITPVSGVLVNGSVTLAFNAPNVTESLTVFVLVTSSYQGTNVSNNFSELVLIVEPYRLNANLVVSSAAAIATFEITVTLDGQPVGLVHVPSLSAGATYPLSFEYVLPSGLSAGWHTFSMNLAQEHGLVSFAGGVSQISSTFYVTGPSPDYGIWYLAGASAFVGAIFIWSTGLGARRRGRSKK